MIGSVDGRWCKKEQPTGTEFHNFALFSNRLYVSDN
jgi:hypothetical protein